MALIKKSNIVNGLQDKDKYRNDLDSDVRSIILAFSSLLDIQALNVNRTTDYGSNALAIAGGLTVGNVYRNGDNLCVVH
jgi:hypothetical protein